MSNWPAKNGKRALMTGITGQDGSYLAELLLGKGYEVRGVVRRASTFNTARIDHIYQDPHEPDLRLHLVYGDLNDASSLNKLLKVVRPDEIYNLGAQSHVKVSFDVPEYTAEVTGIGAVRLLEAMRELGLERAVLPGVLVGAVRQGRRGAPDRDARRSTRAAPTPRPRPTRSTSPATTARRTGCSRSTASSSTTSPRAAARPS